MTDVSFFQTWDRWSVWGSSSGTADGECSLHCAPGVPARGICSLRSFASRMPVSAPADPAAGNARLEVKAAHVVDIQKAVMSNIPRYEGSRSRLHAIAAIKGIRAGRPSTGSCRTQSTEHFARPAGEEPGDVWVSQRSHGKDVRSSTEQMAPVQAQGDNVRKGRKVGEVVFSEARWDGGLRYNC